MPNTKRHLPWCLFVFGDFPASTDTRRTQKDTNVGVFFVLGNGEGSTPPQFFSTRFYANGEVQPSSVVFDVFSRERGGFQPLAGSFQCISMRMVGVQPAPRVFFNLNGEVQLSPVVFDTNWESLPLPTFFNMNREG